MRLTLAERVEAYRKRFPRFPAPHVTGNLIEGVWLMGNRYKTSGYYGAYPYGYLNRVMAMFPDASSILHVFSGSLPPGPYTRLDIRPEMNPDVVGDAHHLSSLFRERPFDLILADPPYSVEDAEHYGRPMVKRQIVLRECLSVLKPGGWVIWLDQVLPNYRKAEVDLAMIICMIRSTNHRVRAVFGFRSKQQ